MTTLKIWVLSLTILFTANLHSQDEEAAADGAPAAEEAAEEAPKAQPIIKLLTGTENIKIPAGSIFRPLELVKSVPSDMLKWDVSKFRQFPQLGDNETYAIVYVKVAPEKSIGKYDYVLGESPCLAMVKINTAEQEPFDPENWQYTGKEAQQVKLLYKVPVSENGSYELHFEYPTITTIKKTAFAISSKASDGAGEGEGEGEGDADGGKDGGEGEADGGKDDGGGDDGNPW